MEEVSKRAIELLVVLPSWTIGEMLQPTLNLGIELLIVSYMKGTKKAYPNTVSGYVDVVRAHVLRADAISALARWCTVRSLYG
jgi:cinnamoyl-CoA reductase